MAKIWAPPAEPPFISATFLVGFYCLPAFVGARSHPQQQQPPLFHSHNLLLLFTPTPSNNDTLPAYPCSRRGNAGGGSSTHAGLGDSEAACALNWNDFCNSHTGTKTTAVTAARGRGGVKVLNKQSFLSLTRHSSGKKTSYWKKDKAVDDSCFTKLNPTNLLLFSF